MTKSTIEKSLLWIFNLRTFNGVEQIDWDNENKEPRKIPEKRFAPIPNKTRLPLVPPHQNFLKQIFESCLV